MTEIHSKRSTGSDCIIISSISPVKRYLKPHRSRSLLAFSSPPAGEAGMSAGRRGHGVPPYGGTSGGRASSDAKHAGFGDRGAAKDKRRKVQNGLQDRVVALEFVVGDLGAVGVPLDLFILDELRKDVVPEGVADEFA